MKPILKYILKHKKILIISSMSSILVIAADSLNPYIQKIIVDKVLLSEESKLFIPLLSLLLMVTILKTLLGYVKEFGFDKIAAYVQKDLKITLFSHIQSLDFSYFDNTNTGVLMSRIGEDIDNIWQTVGFGMRLIVENVIYFVISSIILINLSFKLSLICILIMVPIGFITIKLETNFLKCYENISDEMAHMNTSAQENIAGVRLVKAFSREKFELSKFLNLNKSYYKLNIKQSRLIANYFPPIDFLTNLSLIVMIIFGGILVIKNEMTLGTLVAFSGYIWNLIWPMRMLGYLVNLLAQNKASTKKIFKIINTLPKIYSSENSIKKEKINGDICFSNVSFKYNDEIILKDINLNIKAGSTVAIMGTTGSGKSSILNLIGRYYDTFEGNITIDGIDIKKIDLSSLRRNMAVVSQDTFLFSDSIENNIKFGNKNATTSELELASKAACCDDFINNLPQKFQTEIGERGLGLSGGQKQRISIARALIRKAPILILDDATSALDMETEFKLLKNLYYQKTRSTTFIVAHRISAVKNSDLILFVQNGEIKEFGTHDELLNAHGSYYDVYTEQFKDFQNFKSEVI